ncbi:probable calcium-binding protein CML18 [Ipomoea triloba]|uniref:probable calcium-binding protein CML18 n=1 Tax=Ipomoea triloba TaxID=35885 RepID=UPI00125E6A77|nr:probable calcium-binding protein CML18 [Ipomoea triloba]
MASRSHSVRCPCCQPPSEEQLRKLFNNHDANRDASLSKKEIEKAFDELGSTVPGWRARRALRRADSDRNGFIDDEEEMLFLAMHQSLSKKEIEKAFDELGSTLPGWRARRALRRADSDRNGFIDDEEEMSRLVKYAHSLSYKYFAVQ